MASSSYPFCEKPEIIATQETLSFVHKLSNTFLADIISPFLAYKPIKGLEIIGLQRRP
jgi:hypothetical protein